MHNIIKLGDSTTLADIATWRFEARTLFQVTKNSGFEVGIQGIAIAALRTAIQNKSVITLHCDFDEPRTSAELAEGFFCSAFAFSLTRIAHEVQFRNHADASTVRFKAALGLSYKEAGGWFSSGSRQSIIFADPVYPVPPKLLITGESKSDLPTPSRFRATLQQSTAEMGFRRLFSSVTEAALLRFVYELISNTQQHGIPAGFRGARSTRAIILEKTVLTQNTVASLAASDELSLYLRRVFETGRTGIGVLCITVSDQGDGIQHTMPQSGETEEQLLAKAFLSGQSRKPSSTLSRGLGLAAVLAAAFELQAMLRVCSAGIIGIEDFSSGEKKHPYISFDNAKNLPDHLNTGTSISIFLPESTSDLDQHPLF